MPLHPTSNLKLSEADAPDGSYHVLELTSGQQHYFITADKDETFWYNTDWETQDAIPNTLHDELFLPCNHALLLHIGVSPLLFPEDYRLAILHARFRQHALDAPFAPELQPYFDMDMCRMYLLPRLITMFTPTRTEIAKARFEVERYDSRLADARESIQSLKNTLINYTDILKDHLHHHFPDCCYFDKNRLCSEIRFYHGEYDKVSPYARYLYDTLATCYEQLKEATSELQTVTKGISAGYSRSQLDPDRPLKQAQGLLAQYLTGKQVAPKKHKELIETLEQGTFWDTFGNKAMAQSALNGEAKRYLQTNELTPLLSFTVDPIPVSA
jgi:hypothetical protein